MKITIDGWAWLPKSEMSDDNISWLKDALTLTQRVSREYSARSKPAVVSLWKEETDRFGVPREFFFEKLTKNHELICNGSAGQPWPERAESPMDGNGKPLWPQDSDKSELTFFDSEKLAPMLLRDQQAAAAAAVMDRFGSREISGGMVEMPTGSGKTILALAIAKQLKLKTAVLVHREFLMNQWRKRIVRYFPDCKIGTIAGAKWDNVEDCHVCLVMIQTVSSWSKKKKVPPELHDMFGFVIMDEVHRGGAPLWGLAMPEFNAKYRLGISAHPKRSDGLDNVLKYHIGPKLFTGTQILQTPKIRRVWSNYKITHPRLNLNLMSMEFAFKLMSADVAYNQDVIDQIKGALKAKRKMLVYSHTVKHLQRLKEELDNQWKDSAIKTDYFIGGMSEDEQDVASEADVIFCTFAMAKDALDIPAIDTVILAGPIRNPQQPAGRALREYPDKKEPIVVDMRADAVPIFREYAESRDNAYIRLYGDQTQQKLPTKI